MSKAQGGMVQRHASSTDAVTREALYQLIMGFRATDLIAAAAELVMGKLEMVPAAIVRGLKYEKSEDGIGRMLRNRELDLFR